MRKINLNEKLPRSVLYLRKIALEVELLALWTIVDILLLKLCIENQRLNLKVAQLIQINKNNARMSYRYSESMLLTERKYELNVIM